LPRHVCGNFLLNADSGLEIASVVYVKLVGTSRREDNGSCVEIIGEEIQQEIRLGE
jgi:hypothetical protein